MLEENCLSWLNELDELASSCKQRTKAADLNGICVEHLLFSHVVLPRVLAKVFNLSVDGSQTSQSCHVGLRDSCGMSYTVRPYTLYRSRLQCLR